jgi:ankyrin repeat protein
MYARMLYQIPGDHEQTAVKILQWLTYSTRQLSTNEVAEVLCVVVDVDPRLDPERRFPDPRDILEICPGLVISTETDIQDSSSTILGEQMQLAHYSVKEFLVSKRIQKLAPNYSIGQTEANVSMAEACLAYLLLFDSPGSVHPGVLEEFPLAAYAAQHWTTHAKLAGNGGSVIPLIMKLFDGENPAYANWTCLYNPDKQWQSPSSAIKKRADGEEDIPPPPLYIASLCGLPEVTSILLESGAYVDETAGECGNALQGASRGGHEEVVRQLLEAGANVNTHGGLYGNALVAAAFWGHGKVVQCLLDSGADVNQSGGKYTNALHAASREGHLQIVQTLLHAGADVAAPGGFYGDALQAAAFYGHDSIVTFFLGAGADVNQQSGRIYGNALQAASRKGYDTIVRDLLDAGARVDIASGMYHTALQSAARGAHGLVIKRLLEAGADVNARGGKYGNALQAACLMDDNRVVQQLLDAGADVNASGGMYGNALQTACAHGRENVVRILLDAGANVNMKEGYHGSAVIAAAKNGYHKIVKQLLDAGADVHGWKIPITVSRPSHKQVFHLLQEAGAKVNLDSDSGTLLDIGASQKGSQNVSIPHDFEEIKIADNDILQAALTVKFCDECNLSIPNGAKYYHCEICHNDDWDSCEDCVKAGFPCRDRRHKMVRRQIKNGIIMNIDDD